MENTFTMSISEGLGYADAVYEHIGMPHTSFEKSRISWDRDHWNLKFPDGTFYRFPEAYFAKKGSDGALMGVQGPTGEEIKFARDFKHNLVSLTSPHGHWIKFAYDAQNRIVSAHDDAGQQSNYFYDKTGRLNHIDNGKTTWIYLYNSDGMTAVQHSEYDRVLSISYKYGIVETVQLTKGPVYHFDYLFDRNRNVIETRVSGGSGNPAIFRFGKFPTN